MRICYASRVRSEAISRVISSRFVRPAYHSERIFQSPRFIQTGLSILRFQKGVVSPPQPPWRLLEAAKCSHVGGLTNPNTYLLVYLIYDYILIGWKFSFPQPPWRPLQAAVQKLITTTLFSLERLFWIKNQFSNSKNRSQTQILEKQNATSKIFSTHCGMAWTLVGQLTF